MFIFFQPNPLEKQEPNKSVRADCSVRAVCAALNISWEESYKQLCDYAAEVYEMPNGKIGFEHAIQKLGFVIQKMPRIQKGQKRMTVQDFASKFPEKIAIMNCAGHYTCVKHGDIYDSWDCGDKPIYSYFELRKEA